MSCISKFEEAIVHAKDLFIGLNSKSVEDQIVLTKKFTLYTDNSAN